MNLQNKIYRLIDEQLSSWELAKINHDNLQQVRTRTFTWAQTSVVVQFNPTRIGSTASKTDAASLARRKCFLCTANQPTEEIGVEVGNYIVQVNPYPIFTNHLVVAHRQHIEQNIEGHFAELLDFAQQMTDFALFFNGINCGASAPDHLHFQAAPKASFPILKDFLNAEKTVVSEDVSAKTYQLCNLHRAVFCIESERIDAALLHFEQLIKRIFVNQQPMFNLLCAYTNGRWQTFVFPRRAARPWQYAAPEPQTLMVSPGTAEMSGVIVMPVEAHFERITSDDIIDIYQQVSLL